MSRAFLPSWSAGLLLTAALLGVVGGPLEWQARAQNAPPSLAGGTDLTSRRLEQLQRQLIEQRRLSVQQGRQLTEIRARLRQLSAQQRAALDRLDVLTSEVTDLENELADVLSRVSAATRALRETEVQIRVTRSQVEALKVDARAVMKSLYRARNTQYMRLLSQSNSISDMLIRLDYANMAGQRNVEVMEQLRGAAAELSTQQLRQRQQTDTLRGLQGEQQTKLAELRDRRTRQADALAELQRSAQGQQAVAVRTQAQQALTAQTIDSLVGGVVRERTRLEEQRRRRLEEERKRREAEARRIREAQERARKEAERLARIRAEQERKAREAAEAARQKALAEARAAAQAKAAAEAKARAAAQAQAAAQARAQAEAQARAQAAATARAEAQARAARQAQRQAQAAQKVREQAVARERRDLQTQQQQATQQEKQLAAELAPLPAISSRDLGFPLPGGKVAAPYGTSGAQWEVLSGASGGQAVAAQTGNVLASAYYAALGWVILLDHGSNVITGYFGLQDTLVEVGQRVERGTPLGTTGGSHIFGPDRMAFQVRDGETPVAPPF